MSTIMARYKYKGNIGIEVLNEIYITQYVQMFINCEEIVLVKPHKRYLYIIVYSSGWEGYLWHIRAVFCFWPYLTLSHSTL